MAERCPDCGAEVERVARPPGAARASTMLVDTGPGSIVSAVDLRADGRSVYGVVVAGRRLHQASCPGRNASPKAPSVLVSPIVEFELPEGYEFAGPPSDGRPVRADAPMLQFFVSEIVERKRLLTLAPGLRAIARALIPLLDNEGP